ncbi:hypothetical protein LY90DRAFT_518776 [Neocallimastix californiae]|uniref:Uncharacterized protein n=1 Tax=Neocallimastix californiae TaxID=1754190 RepID=A0A1Y1ZIE2_9FUNG|nr:hypothetical protein LY90DRAFT_518776 [Neocallimastix californiae]|eukprot:ORY10012.1 hypothetical protein LY90DRAFT_518776 [Neocallimastix californiae]
MNIEKENNTELFFKELKSKTCNLEILYNLSLKGIYLYKKIKYNEYVVDISLMNKQYFKIYNDRQYDRLIEKFEKYEENINLSNISKYIGNYYVSSHMKIKFDKDIKVLEYIIINLCNNIKYH